MKVRKLVAMTLIATLLASGTTMISGAEVRGEEETTVQMTQITLDSKASLPDNELVDEVILDDTTELLKATPSDATPSDATYVSTEEELRGAVQTSGTVVVEGEIQLSEPLDITGGINIDLSGGTISYSGVSRQMISIEGAGVSFSNITIDATGMDCDDTYDNGFWADYYVVSLYDNSRIEIREGTNIVTYDKDIPLVNPRKRGVIINGQGEMTGGTISGFSDVGIAVGRESTFALKGGNLCGNGWGKKENWEGTGGLVVFNSGEAYIEYGSINLNAVGIFNNGYVSMCGGEVVENQSGLINNNKDGMSGEEFSPIAEISGGTISGNKRAAIINRTRGKVTISGDAVVEGSFISEMQDQTMVMRAKSKAASVIRNEEYATLNIEGGTITAHAPGEIAISNDSTGKINMTAGEVIAAGELSVAIQNENATIGAVKISGGGIQSTGTGSKAIDNPNGGYMEITEDVTIDTGDNEQYLIAVNHTRGGKISPSSQMASANEVITITAIPDSGYKITDLIVDGVSQGAVSSYELKVEGKSHSIIATFEAKPSSGGSSSGGGGSSSGSSKVSTTSTPLIPETPGSWIQNETGWKFTQPDGTAYVNTWIRKSGQWYWVGADSYMVQGWTLIDGVWYYLTPISGEMKTGWLDDNGIWYYLDKDGKKAVNTTTPDGYKVDANGAWIK